MLVLLLNTYYLCIAQHHRVSLFKATAKQTRWQRERKHKTYSDAFYFTTALGVVIKAV